MTRRRVGQGGGAGAGFLLPAAAAMVAAATLGTTAAPAVSQEATNEEGRQVYEKWCAGCHGVDGRGDGPAAEWMLPRPRDFTTALFQIRTTPSGSLPTDEDILRVIEQGMPGTTMPAWESLLSAREQEAVKDYVKSFSRFFGQGPPPEPMEFGSPPSLDDEALATGREVFERVECYRCHGQAGRGDGTSAPTLEDDQDRPIRAADLTQNWRFNGGGSVEEIYRRMRTGLDGTPMPSQSDLLQAGVVTEDELWNLARYVRSLSPERAPRVREVISAELASEGIPSLSDDAWNDVERFWIPLVGQIIQEPRWFDPRVSGVWVQALHDGSELALRVSWDDPSESPDAAWAPWRARMLELMEPHEGDTISSPHPDQLVVQFPTQIPEGRERPYFLMGDSRRPVYLWRWRSDEGGAEMTARGFGTQALQADADQELSSEAAFADGRWTVLFRRALDTGGEDEDLQVPTSTPIPVSFFAWDGDNGEWGGRSAVSSWYFLYLKQETPVTVYVAPALALVLTAALGLLVVARAQRRERDLEREGEGETEGATATA